MNSSKKVYRTQRYVVVVEVEKVPIKCMSCMRLKEYLHINLDRVDEMIREPVFGWVDETSISVC